MRLFTHKMIQNQHYNTTKRREKGCDISHCRMFPYIGILAAHMANHNRPHGRPLANSVGLNHRLFRNLGHELHAKGVRDICHRCVIQNR
jgi:hypothetical protein